MSTESIISKSTLKSRLQLALNAGFGISEAQA